MYVCMYVWTQPLYDGTNDFYIKPKIRQVYNTGDSQVVTHQSTNPTQQCVTSVIT